MRLIWKTSPSPWSWKTTRFWSASVLARFPVDGQQYIALQPEDEEHGEDIYLYRFSEDENGQPVLGMIETEDEYEAVADRFDEILDEAEYDEIVGDEEDE